jgi:hypothetical protein
MSTPVASPRLYDDCADSKRDAKDLLAGVADGSLRLSFIGSKSGQPRLRVRMVSPNEAAIEHVRSSWNTKVYVVRSKKNGGRTATADFEGDAAISVLRYVSRRGVVHRRAAEIALGLLKGIKEGGVSDEDFATIRAELEKELSAVAESEERTREVRKIVRKRKADDESGDAEDASPAEKKFVTEKFPTEDEVSSIVSTAEQHRKWIEGFVAASAAFRESTETDDGKRKGGRVIVATNKMPRGAAVSAAIREIVGGGKVGLARPRIAFTSKKEIGKLRNAFGNDRYDFVDFDKLV